ncbi:hypothetical protein Taro_051446 [Colocasia esculenta]|uniref:Aminotransferase-like plant mobile domain-containing protein n=1 Tax=Colocasia esculenta TaxID=4460 RepID=A0A843XG06_COLES|nr:hypothetical protein [Colocasia esculenta]
MAWGINNLDVHAKRYHEIHLDWAALGALIKLWHPQTHTFLFKTFEATILLEEVEVLLGLKQMKRGAEDEMAVMPRSYTSRGVYTTLVIVGVDTSIDGVDTGSLFLELFHEDRVQCVNTAPGSVDTRPSSQET